MNREEEVKKRDEIHDQTEELDRKFSFWLRIWLVTLFFIFSGMFLGIGRALLCSRHP